MATCEELPEAVAELIGSALVGEFATVSAAGVPIDTPTFVFESPDAATIDVATGLAYPAKAERARRNPKVGLLIEGKAREPIVSIAGHAAVRDADLQANAERYLGETSFAMPGNPEWSHARNSVWYWTRIIVQTMPVVVRWWDSADAMDRTPHEWRAPAGPRPVSDPAPPGASSKAPQWPHSDWRELAGATLAKGVDGHLTLLDGEEYPLPFRARAVRGAGDGFELDLPAGILGVIRPGKATLCFDGRATFVGTVDAPATTCRMVVERCLPVLPLVADPCELWAPTDETRASLMARLAQETARRGQAVPEIPEVLPPLTDGARRRLARLMEMGR